MRKYILAIFTLFCIAIHADEPNVVVSAKNGEYKSGKIHLSKEVSISHALGDAFGELATLIPQTPGSKDIFKTLEIREKVKILLKNGGNLRCDIARIYPEESKAIAKRDLSLSDDQVLYQDKRGIMYADKCQFFYNEKATKFLEKLIATGQVSIFNNGSKGHTEQYISADKAEFWPATDKLILSANEDSIVFFYDQTNKIQACASQLEITRCKTTGKEIIKSTDIVHCKLQNDRLKKLKSRFNTKEKK